MSWEEFNPDDNPDAPEYDHVAVRYWDLMQVRYHVLRALDISLGKEDHIPNGQSVEDQLAEAKEALHHLLTDIDNKHIVEVG